MKKNSFSRRDFVKLSAGSLAALTLQGMAPAGRYRDGTGADDLEIYVFSKHLQFLDYADMSEAAREMGFEGIDLTVRPKGHVLPERVAEDLPRATEAMRSFGFSPRIMTTKVRDPDNPGDRLILETAAPLGYDLYRMGWLRYPEERSIPESMEIYRELFTNLAGLNGKLGIRAAYQNHHGLYMGSAIWDIHQALEGIAPDWIGCQYDIRHATLEGARNWPLGLRLIRHRINSIVIKDFKWERSGGQWTVTNCPVGEGMVDLPAFFSLVKKYRLRVPVIMHFEYDLGGAEHGAASLTVSRNEVFSKMKKDLGYVREAWAKVNERKLK